MSARQPRVGVVGHVEWVQFAVVGHMPAAGEIVSASEAFEEAAGGGAVAAVQLRRLAGAARLLTTFGDDENARRARAELAGRHGLDVHGATRHGGQRRAFCHLDGGGERTITVLGERLMPRGDDPLPWDDLGELDAVYFTAGDAAALRAARAARVLVATPRAWATISGAGVQLDALVASATDPGEQVDAAALRPAPHHVVRTHGAEGGAWTAADGRTGTWAAAALPAEPLDAYGAGDSFAAGLTYGLGAGMDLHEALALGAECGAWCLTGRGPYGNQLTRAA